MNTPIEFQEGTAQIAYGKALERVVEILDSVKGTLNIQASTCHGCGHERRNNWEQYQAAEHLAGAITRIEKAASLISASIGTPPLDTSAAG